MEIFSVFSIADFLAYLFPGMLSLSGIYVILLLSPLGHIIPELPESLGFWIFLIGLSYVFGVLQAGITDILFREVGKDKRRDKNKGIIQIKDKNLKLAVEEAFISIFPDQLQKKSKAGESKAGEKSEEIETWNKYHLYICRSLVTEKMPLAASHGIRESAYRQLRMNLIVPLILWGIAGFYWGIQIWNQTSSPYWIMGRVMVFIVPLITVLLIIDLVAMMDIHERREVREILSSFLAGYHTGIFHDQINKGNK